MLTFLRYRRAVVILNVIAIVYVTNIGSNLLNDIIVTYVPSPSFPRVLHDGIFNAFPASTSLTSILMSRFLLNLRDQRAENERTTRPYSTALTSRPFSTIRFSSNVSHSMAGSMIGDDHNDGDDDDVIDIGNESADNDPAQGWHTKAETIDKDGGLWRCDTTASAWSSHSSEELLVSRNHGAV